MQDKSKQQVLEQIKKLFSYARDGSASQGEVENALGHARRLCQKYNIAEDEALLHAATQNRTQAVYDTIKHVEVFRRAGRLDEHDIIMAHVAHLFDCRRYTDTIYGRNQRGNTSVIQVQYFYGLPQDLPQAVEVYQQLLVIKRAMAHAHYGSGWSRKHTDYALGFSNRIYQRANEEKQKETAPTADPTAANTGAIVLVKDTLLQRYGAQLGLRPRKTKARTSANTHEFNHGWHEGGNVALTNQRLPNPQPRLS